MNFENPLIEKEVLTEFSDGTGLYIFPMPGEEQKGFRVCYVDELLPKMAQGIDPEKTIEDVIKGVAKQPFTAYKFGKGTDASKVLTALTTGDMAEDMRASYSKDIAERVLKMPSEQLVRYQVTEQQKTRAFEIVKEFTEMYK